MANKKRDNIFGLPPDPFGVRKINNNKPKGNSNPFNLGYNLGQGLFGGNNLDEKNDLRAFTRSQKNEIIERQNHLCAKCHERLNLKSVHYHHKVPYSEGGETSTKNGVAVCANCHAIIHHDEKVKKADSRHDDNRPNNPWGFRPF